MDDEYDTNDDYYYQDEINDLRAENNALRADMGFSNFGEDRKLGSEKNFETIAGINEINPRYKDIFMSLLVPSTQWQLVETEAEIDRLVQIAEHNLKTFNMYSIKRRISTWDIQNILIDYRRLLNRAKSGFERNAIITEIHQVNTQTAPINPAQAVRETKGFLSRFSLFGRK